MLRLNPSLECKNGYIYIYIVFLCKSPRSFGTCGKMGDNSYLVNYKHVCAKFPSVF